MEQKKNDESLQKRNQIIGVLVVVVAVLALVVAAVVMGNLSSSEPVADSPVTETESTGGGSQESVIEISEDLSFKQISENTGMPVKMLAQNFEIDESDFDKPISEIKDKYNLKVEDIQKFIDAFTGM